MRVLAFITCVPSPDLISRPRSHRAGPVGAPGTALEWAVERVAVGDPLPSQQQIRKTKTISMEKSLHRLRANEITPCWK